jgi:anthranilate phosphoribosyltransferase
VVEVVGDEVRSYTLDPAEVSLPLAPAEAIPGGDPAANADTAQRIFAGETGPARDLAVLNAGAAIYAAGRAETLAEGARRAEAAIDAGAAAQALERFVARTRELAP